ncbi:MAG: hypothetical protein JNK72_23330 [Myxococcales bacterium]|nr:hypothetical protein [Myxococcales bacterium]
MALFAVGCGDDSSGADAGGTVMGDGAGVRVSIAGTSACARKTDGSPVCWGGNNGQQLGDGSTTDRSSPVAVMGVGAVRDVAVGGFHACAVLADGTAQCWGTNRNGQLGFGMEMTQPQNPVAVSGLTDAREITVGLSHSCVVRRNGSASCWGDNSLGQVGDGSAAGNRAFPTMVVGSSVMTDLVTLDAGNNHTCALRDNGGVVCWGQGTAGQLGNGARNNSPSSVQVSGLADAVALSAGGNHSCAVRQGGTVVCWGANTNGQLGDGSMSDRMAPTPVPGITDAVKVACGAQHTCALRRGGSVLCWGLNMNGQLGDASTMTRTAPTPVMGVSNAVAVAAGQNFSCVVQGNGTALCWGGNGNGQLGRGSFGATPEPVAPVAL